MCNRKRLWQAHVGRRELLTTFLPPFAAGMDAGAQAVMVSYNEIDGAPNANSHYLLTDITRNRAGGAHAMQSRAQHCCSKRAAVVCSFCDLSLCAL